MGAERRERDRAHPVATLRHSFASLLLREDLDVIYAARQLGHSAQLALGTYGHVIEELRGAERVSAEDAIRAARGNSVPSEFLGAAVVAGA